MEVRALKNPDGTRIDFNDISLESLGCHLIFGEVDESSMKEAATFLLKANQLFSKDELTLFVNSVGGSCHDAFALIDLISLSRLPIRTISSGCIMSMGVLIASSGHKGKRIMTRNCEVMAHQFFGGVEGKYHELITAKRGHDLLAHRFIQHFLRHSTMNETQIKDVLFGSSDRWLTPQECKKYGLIDLVIDELPPAPVDEQSLVAPAKRRSPARSRETGPRKKRS